MTINNELKTMMDEARAARGILYEIVNNLEAAENEAAGAILEGGISRDVKETRTIYHNALYRVLLMMDRCKAENEKTMNGIEAISRSVYVESETARDIDIPWE